jgi:hypothetical protein
MTKQSNSEINVTVQINYGTYRTMRDTIIKANAGITALEALQYISSVETHPKGKYVFVTAIDSVKGVRGVMAWYYEVNKKSTKKLAINQPLQDGDVVTWIYKTDVCSAAVDGCNKTK